MVSKQRGDNSLFSFSKTEDNINDKQGKAKRYKKVQQTRKSKGKT